MSRRPPPNGSAARTDDRDAAGGALDGRLSVTNLGGLAGLGVVAISYLLVLADAMADSPLVGLAFVAVIVAASAAFGLVARHDRRGWWMALAVSMLALGTFATRRRSPRLGLADVPSFLAGWVRVTSLAAEGTVVAISLWVLLRKHRA
jgi:hypothetical protein